MFGEKLKSLRLNANLTQEELAKKLNIPRGTYAHYELGKRSPDYDMIKKIADYFGVTTDFLLDMPEQKKTPVKGVKIPVLGNIIAGVPVEAITDITDYEEIHPDLAKTGDFFALKVKGDSMLPKIQADDVVIIRKQPDVECGEIAVILINGEDATLKKVLKKDDGIVLEAYNPVAYSPTFYSQEDVKKLPISILGKIIELRRKF